MFKLQPKGVPIKWPVKVNIPRDGGKVTSTTFYALFLVLDQDELEEASNGSDLQFAQAVIKGWDGVGDELGDELPFTAENLERLVKISYFREGLRFAYFDCINGRAAKN